MKINNTENFKFNLSVGRIINLELFASVRIKLYNYQTKRTNEFCFSFNILRICYS